MQYEMAMLEIEPCIRFKDESIISYNITLPETTFYYRSTNMHNCLLINANHLPTLKGWKPEFGPFIQISNMVFG